MTAQNETLTKRIEDFEARQSKVLQKSQSLKSISTLHDALNEGEQNEDAQNKTEKNATLNDILEWKKDIEKSLETVSDKVASNTTYLLIELEKSITECNCDHLKLKKNFEDNLDNILIYKKNLEKIDKTEKLITNILQGMSDMKNSNVKWQADFLKNLNDFNEKMIVQESTLEELENFENNVNKKFNIISSDLKTLKLEIKSLPGFVELKQSESTKKLESSISSLSEDNRRINDKLTSEIVKIEGIY